MEVTAGQVKARAAELGFDLCGIARAHPVDPERLDRWLSQGWDAGLAYVREQYGDVPSYLAANGLSAGAVTRLRDDLIAP